MTEQKQNTQNKAEGNKIKYIKLMKAFYLLEAKHF